MGLKQFSSVGIGGVFKKFARAGQLPEADPQTVERELKKAKAEECHVIVSALDATRSAQGRIESFTEDSVIIALLQEQDTAYFWPGTLASLSYYREQMARVFLTRVFRHDQGEFTKKQRLIVQRPKNFAAMDGRLTHRIPLPKECPLLASVQIREHKISPLVRNISVTGLLVDLIPDPELSINEEVQVVLNYEEVTTPLIPTVIRRREKSIYGLAFKYAVSMGNLVPPPMLREIVRRIERLHEV